MVPELTQQLMSNVLTQTKVTGNDYWHYCT